ncbi:MAG TPA: FAD-dependent oxidoreductase [Pirellulaceae bacterium]|jgi:protoporphyrinogen oxidase|nr:FAD-dependent oxidoreductase [Pirellulaceae bacterium]
MRRPALVVFSHLRWNFVFQRPQHLMTRLAKDRQVFFIEEPIHDEQGPSLTTTEPSPGIRVCVPHTPLPAHGFDDAQLALIEPMVRDLLAEQVDEEYDLWFYAPMASPIAEKLDPRVVIFDNMDDLASFKSPPPGLKEREAELVQRADVVFTGGPSLYRAMKDRHPHCMQFSSSVDAAHFGKARSGLADPPEQASIPRPRLGFFGVLDERFDIPLLAAAAEARPDWQFVMVGPVAKIDPADLPRRDNIHYLGQQPYEALPSLLAGWDVALLPFARNESTRRISPTKVLEYMAANKPVVSTRIADIVDPYGTMVGLGDEPEEFIAACDQALNESEDQLRQRTELFESVLSKTSWDSTAVAMSRAIEDAAFRVGRAQIESLPTRRPTLPQNRSRLLSDAQSASSEGETYAPVVVVGAGPTGLSAAYHLGADALLLEANDTVGGWCRSIEDRGFTFDFAGHIMFSNDPYVHRMYDMLLGDNVHWQDREAWIYSKNVFTRYPFQGSLYGLPADVIKECIMGAIEARFGSLDKKEGSPGANGPATNGAGKSDSNGHAKSDSNGHSKNGSNGHASNGNGHHADGKAGNGKSDGSAKTVVSVERNGSATTCRVSNGTSDPKDLDLTDCCGDGLAEAEVKLVAASEAPKAASPSDAPKNFEEFIYKVWGAGIAKHFAIPYNRKIWAVPLDQMETSWLGGRVPLPDLGEMIEGALQAKGKPMGPNARFGYPLRGGFQALMNGFLPLLEGELRLNARVAKVSPSERMLVMQDGTEIEYDQLVSTMPLPSLVRAMGDEAPEEVRQAASALRYTSVRCVNIGVGRETLTDKHWIYYPEETVFHRIFVQGNASPHCNPAGGFGLTCEITYGPSKPLPCDGEELIQRCIADCISVGLIREDDPILASNQVDMPYAYVVYDHARPKNVQLIRDWMQQHDIHLAGRYSEWEYYNSDHAFLAGKKVAEAAREKMQAKPAAT